MDIKRTLNPRMEILGKTENKKVFIELSRKSRTTGHHRGVKW